MSAVCAHSRYKQLRPRSSCAWGWAVVAGVQSLAHWRQSSLSHQEFCCSKEREEEDTELRPVYVTPLLSTAGADLTVSRLCFDMRDASYSTFFAGCADGLLACVKLATNEVCALCWVLAARLSLWQLTLTS